jgi:hypothetical protein
MSITEHRGENFEWIRKAKWAAVGTKGGKEWVMPKAAKGWMGGPTSGLGEFAV